MSLQLLGFKDLQLEQVAVAGENINLEDVTLQKLDGNLLISAQEPMAANMALGGGGSWSAW